MEQILIAAPTADVKNYCLQDWLTHLNALKYPKFAVFLADNTPDNGENASYIRELAASLPLVYNIRVAHIPSAKTLKSLHARLAAGHNLCREVAIDYRYRHWLHLETDMFPPTDVIERLLAHNKKVVGAMYHRDEGVSRRLMVQMNFFKAPNNVFADNARPEDDPYILDGTLKKFPHVGLGCVLLRDFAFKRIAFRHKEGTDSAPDSWFAIDCAKHNIEIFGDTSLLCEHRNQAWGLYGVDFK